MDQEAEIMKQSRARQEAAQAAAEEGDEEEEPEEPLRTVSSGARGVAVSKLQDTKSGTITVCAIRRKNQCLGTQLQLQS